MKFLYEYNTKGNERRSGEIFATDRDAAFRALRERGVKPFNMVEAPGFFNKLFGKGKRWIAIGVLTAVAVGALLYARRAKESVLYASDGVGPMPRHQVYGDPALLDSIEREDFRSVFTNAGDRVLAQFARPGVYVKRVAGPDRAQIVAALAEIPATADPVVENGDGREVAEFKRIVCGMRSELRRYLSVGKGTPASYLFRLYERQDRELAIYSNALSDLKKEKDHLKFERINQSLRAMGLKTVLMSDIDEGAENESGNDD